MSKGLLALGPAAVKEVQVSDGKSFTVRGLSLPDVLTIYQRHAGDLAGLFERLVSSGDGGPKVSLEQASFLGGALLAGAPHIACEIIAIAAGDPGDELTEQVISIARGLPGPVQLDALDKIAALTFTSDQPPKKVFETVVRMASGVAKTMGALTSQEA